MAAAAATSALTGATAANYSSLTWNTSGDGTFVTTTSLNPTYTPGTTDISNGTVTLTRLASPTPDQLHSLVRLDQDETCTNPLHRPGCSCIEDAANTDPRQPALLQSTRHEGAVPYIPCSNRGRHELLTECWMCWSDVHRGAITVEQALQGSTNAR